MKKIKQHQSSIIISLLVGVFIFYFQPVLQYFGNALVDFLIFISHQFAEFYYSSIALNDTSLFDRFTFEIVILVIGGLLYIGMRNIDMKKNNLREDITKTINSLKKQQQDLKTGKTKEIRTAEEIYSDLSELEQEAIILKANLYKRDIHRIAMYILIIFFVVLGLAILAINTSISTQNAIFRNNIIQISPFLNENEIKNLNAKWAEMEKEEDYSAIYIEINKIKQANNIK